MTRPLRGTGPIAIVSSSDTHLREAERVAKVLRENGCRVSIETESRIQEEGPALALEHCEVFIQLRGPAEPSPHGILDRRFRDATNRVDRDATMLLIPIAVGSKGASYPFFDWAYIDAGSDALSSEAFELIERIAHSAVHALPLSHIPLSTLCPCRVPTWRNSKRVVSKGW